MESNSDADSIIKYIPEQPRHGRLVVMAGSFANISRKLTARAYARSKGVQTVSGIQIGTTAGVHVHQSPTVVRKRNDLLERIQEQIVAVETFS